jgi:SAM-dependent methyltransferase
MQNIEEVVEKYIAWAPVSLAIREVSRINALKILDQKLKIFDASSILDIGCGDGKWWTYTLPEGLNRVHGIDISKSEISLAAKYISSQCLDVTSSEFINEIKIKNYQLVIGNCSLEHVYRIDKAFQNIYRVMEKDGYFILLVPTPYWALKGKSIKFLNNLSPRLSMAFSGLVNGFFQHWHLYNDNLWRSILSNYQFKVEEVYGLGNGKSEFIFRLGLVPAFFSFLVKCLTGKYLTFFIGPLIPKRLKNKIAQSLVKCLETELLSPHADDIFEYMFVCRK